MVLAPPLILYSLVLVQTILYVFISLWKYIIFSEPFLSQLKSLRCRHILRLSELRTLFSGLDGPETLSELDDLIFKFRYFLESVLREGILLRCRLEELLQSELTAIAFVPVQLLIDGALFHC